MYKFLSFLGEYGVFILTALVIVSKFIKQRFLSIFVIACSIPFNIVFILFTPTSWVERCYAIVLVLEALRCLHIVFTTKTIGNKRKDILHVPRELLGESGVVKITLDTEQHFKEQYRTAHQNDPEGMYNLACCYRSEIGTERNIPLAVFWASKLAHVQDEFWKNEGTELLKEMKQDIIRTSIAERDDYLALIEEALKLFCK